MLNRATQKVSSTSRIEVSLEREDWEVSSANGSSSRSIRPKFIFGKKSSSPSNRFPLTPKASFIKIEPVKLSNLRKENSLNLHIVPDLKQSANPEMKGGIIGGDSAKICMELKKTASLENLKKLKSLKSRLSIETEPEIPKSIPTGKQKNFHPVLKIDATTADLEGVDKSTSRLFKLIHQEHPNRSKLTQAAGQIEEPADLVRPGSPRSRSSLKLISSIRKINDQSVISNAMSSSNNKVLKKVRFSTKVLVQALGNPKK